MLVKTLIITTLFLVGCGDLSKSIDKATDEAKAQREASEKDEADKAEKEPATDSGLSIETTTSVTVVTTTTVNGQVSNSADSEDEKTLAQLLVGTWVSQCDDGITITMIFDGSMSTKITSVYSDLNNCSGMPQTLSQRLGYEVIGDNALSFGKAEPAGFDITADVLTMDADATYVYRRK